MRGERDMSVKRAQLCMPTTQTKPVSTHTEKPTWVMEHELDGGTPLVHTRRVACGQREFLN